MSVKKVDKNKWLVDIQPNGRRGKRIRKYFKTKAEAEVFSRWAYEQARQNTSWAMPKQDNRKFSELIEIWYEGHGKTLIKSKARYNVLKTICADLNDPEAEAITTEKIVQLRNLYLTRNIKKTTINKYMDYLRIFFNQLINLEKWAQSNPVKAIKPLKTKELEVRYLSTDEIKELLTKLNQSRSKNALNVAKICLATGARWSEAESLTKSQIGDDRITFIKTKNGKSRTVPINSELCAELKSYKTEKLFKKCRDTFSHYLKKCSFEVREHQASHVLRHTFASHFIANGGNIIALKEILGHSDIKMTMIYAHYSPEHLEQAKTLNPLTLL